MTTSTTDHCPCGKRRAHLDADPDSQEWACRVPDGTGADGHAADSHSCPTAYQVQTALACPDWCELPADHDADAELRAHRAAVWELDDRAHVSVAEFVSRRDGEFDPVEIAVDFTARMRGLARGCVARRGLSTRHD